MSVSAAAALLSQDSDNGLFTAVDKVKVVCKGGMLKDHADLKKVGFKEVCSQCSLAMSNCSGLASVHTGPAIYGHRSCYRAAQTSIYASNVLGGHD